MLLPLITAGPPEVMTWLILFVTESVMELMTGPVCASPLQITFTALSWSRSSCPGV